MELGGMNYQTREKRPPNTLGEERTKSQDGAKGKRPIFCCGYTNKHVTAREAGVWSDQVRCMAELVRGLRISLDRPGGWYSDQRERERRGFIDGGSATPK
jgi:hypothetical protein